MAELAVTSALVMLRIIAASWSNVLQKRFLTPNKSPVALVAEIWGWMTLLTAPAWLAAMARSLSAIQLGTEGYLIAQGDVARAHPVDLSRMLLLNDLTFPATFWLWMCLASALELPGNWLLLRSLQRTNLSIYGPLNSFKPMVSMIAAILLLGEFPSAPGIVGMSIVLLGSLGLAEPSDNRRGAFKYGVLADPGVRDRMLAMCMTATASVFLKRAMPGATSWEVLGVWSLLGWVFALVFLRATRWWAVSSLSARPSLPAIVIGPTERNHRKFFLSLPVWIAFSMLAMQGMTVAVFERMPVAYALALFQLGSLASVYLGHRVFGEPHFWRRLTACAIMILGAVLIVVAN